MILLLVLYDTGQESVSFVPRSLKNVTTSGSCFSHVLTTIGVSQDSTQEIRLILESTFIPKQVRFDTDPSFLMWLDFLLKDIRINMV